MVWVVESFGDFVEAVIIWMEEERGFEWKSYFEIEKLFSP